MSEINIFYCFLLLNKFKQADRIIPGNQTISRQEDYLQAGRLLLAGREITVSQDGLTVSSRQKKSISRQTDYLQAGRQHPGRQTISKQADNM
jgi:hypothetical protein